MMLMIVVVTAAVLVMFMVMMLVFIMIVVMVVFMLIMVVVMFMLIVVMIVTAAGAVLVMFMVVMMLVFILIVVVMVVMLVLIIMVMMVMIVLCSFLQKLLEFIVKGILLCHCINKLLTCKLVPVGSYDRCGRILFTQALYAVIQLFLRKSLCMAENETACVCDLVIEEFAEILHVHLVFFSINNSCETVKFNIVSVDVLYCTDNVAEFADT